MAANEIRVGDIGTVFYGTILDQDSTVLDISTATTKQLIMLLPDGTKLEKTATFYTDGSDGKLQYTIASGDLSIPGVYRLQWYIVMPSGSWKTDIKTMKVYSNL